MRLLPWSIESSSYPLIDPWIRVRADECRRANGASVSPYYVIENSEWVTVFAVTQSAEVILITEYHHGARIVGVGLPGGGTADDRETPLEAASRELLEETGYAPSRLVPMGSAFANWGNQTNRVHFFLASECTLVAPQALDENEEIEISLVPLAAFSPTSLEQSYHLTAALLAVQLLT